MLLAAGLVLDGAVSSPWQLYLSYGLLTAVGVAAAGWVPAVLLVRGWYPQRVGTMLGLTSAGIGVGISVFVPLCQWLIDLVGWHPGAPPGSVAVPLLRYLVGPLRGETFWGIAGALRRYLEEAHPGSGQESRSRWDRERCSLRASPARTAGEKQP